MSSALELSPPRALPKTNIFAFLSLFVALVAISFAAIFIRFSETELSANGTVFNRFFIFFVVFGTGKAISAIRQPSADPKPQTPLTLKNWLLLLCVGLTATISLVLWAFSLTQISVANSVLLNNLTPLFAGLGGWLFLGRRFDRRFILGTIVAFVGAISLGIDDFQLADGSWSGDAWALLSAVFLAAYFLLVEQLRDRFDATSILLCRCAIGSVLLFPLLLFSHEPLFPTSWTGWFAVISLGLICEGMGQRILADSLDKFSSSFVCLFLLLEPLCSAFLAWLIFSENLSLGDWCAFSVVLAGIYIAKSSKVAVKTCRDVS